MRKHILHNTHVLMSNKMIRGSVKISGKLGKIRIRLSDYLVLCNKQNNQNIVISTVYVCTVWY